MANDFINLFGAEGAALFGEVKQSRAGEAISRVYVNQQIATPRNYQAYASEGYLYNPIVNKCVKEIADSVCMIRWKLRNKSSGKEIERHPALDLLHKPNPMMTGNRLMQEIVSYDLIAGNSYIEATSSKPAATKVKNPKEIYVLRPDYMRVVAGNYGMPSRYEYEHGGITIQWAVNQVTGESLIHHRKQFNPINDWYGASGTEPAAFSIDQHNAAGQHNASLLKNSATPSGVMVYKKATSNDEAMLRRAEVKLRGDYTGAANAGKPMVLSGEVDWINMSFNPKDLDMHQGKQVAAEEICLAFGVDPVLVLTNKATFNNKESARMSLWENRILPIADDLQRGLLNNWLAPMFGDDIEFYYDVDDVPALAMRRNEHRNRVMSEYSSGLITRDQAREKLGYEPAKDGGDQYYGQFAQPSSADTGATKSTAPDEKKNDYSTLAQVANEIDQPAILGATSGVIENLLKDVVALLGKEVVQELGEAAAFQQTANVQNYIADKTATLVTQVNETTKNTLRGIISESVSARESVDALKDRIKDAFDSFSVYRSKMIAVTESTSAAGFASLEAIQQSGIEKVEWLSTLDSNTRDTHASMDGQIVDAGAFFQSPSGAKAKRPAGFGIASEDINCRCAITAVFEGEKSDADARRREIYNRREQKRVSQEPRFEAAYRDIFAKQRDAVLKRIDDVTV